MDDKKRKKTELLEERSKRLAEEIQSKQKRNQERKQIEELGKRISLARDGRAAFEKSAFPVSLNCYRRYLILTEQQLKKPLAQIRPSDFEEKNRVQESILISAIGFDMAVMLDKLSSPDAARERRESLGLFVKFSVGMPFQHFAADNLRRYMEYSTNIRHKKEFKSALSAVSKGKYCLLATLVYEESNNNDLITLREFRDTFLSTRNWGAAIVDFYYLRGPSIVPVWHSSKFTRKLLTFLVKKVVLPLAKKINGWQ